MTSEATRWTVLAAALDRVFRDHDQDPTFNYELDQGGRTVRIPHFGGDRTETIRIDVADADLDRPDEFAAWIYSQAMRPD